MTLWTDISNTGLNFAKNPAERRGILLSNQISAILISLQCILFALYAYWYGWNVITAIMPFLVLLYLLPILANKNGFVNFSRMFLCVLIPVIVLAISIYAKTLYYENQEELDYFTFRFIMLASCVFPPILFSIREPRFLITFLAFDLLTLMLFDPLHHLFGVPYNKPGMSLYYYYFTNVIVFLTFSLIAGAVWFMKWTSEKFEEKNDELIDDLNRINEQLVEKNAEIEAQNQEIIAQTEHLSTNQQKLTDAYRLIEEQRNLLFRQNKNLSSEIIEKNKNLTETNAELIKHNNELRQFSYTVSHNLRAPVASLLGLITLMDHGKIAEDNQEIFRHLKTSAGRLDTIINDLGKIIDIRHGIFHIRQKVNLENELSEILKVLEKDIRERDVVIERSLTAPAIYSIQPMVHSILYNLISNGIKYCSPERRPVITVSSREDEKNLILEVTDNGLGIDLERYRDSLFKLYKRFHVHMEGKGLGLYLVKLQTEALGGYIHVASEINRFTSFTVYLSKPENITRQILYQESYAEIFYDAQLNATGTVWHGPITSAQYRSVFLKCLEFVKVYHTPNYITDLSHQGMIVKADQLWMFEQILPEARRHGLIRIAAIRPDAMDEAVAEYVAGIKEATMRLGYHQEFFLTREDAADWIQRENEKASLRFRENEKNY
jgi:signal transduction histidine kinase